MNEWERKIVLRNNMFGLLKQMVEKTEKEDIGGFRKLNRQYSKLYDQVFTRVNESQESREWDITRNELAYVLSAKLSFLNGRIDRETYEKRAKENLADALKRFNEIKKYLK